MLNLRILSALFIAAITFAPLAAESNPSAKSASTAVQHTRPTKVPYAVLSRNIIRRVEPVYPADINIHGTVVLRAIIDDQGRVTSLKVISGHPMLRGAAIDAVKQWRYHPYRMLSGKAGPVETTIPVTFGK
jgi:protein TonB